MLNKKEKLIIDYLNLMYTGNTERHIYSYTSSLSSSQYTEPISVVLVDRKPIVEIYRPYKSILENNFNLNSLKNSYLLNFDFKNQMFLIFGEIPNLTELVVEWISKKELNNIGRDVRLQKPR